jgi:MFS family permease
MRTKALWLIVAGYVLTGFPAAGLIANMVPYFRDQGMSPHLASWAFAFFGFGALFGRPTWGFIAGRFGVHLGLTLYGLGYGLSIAFYTFASTDTALFIAAWPLGLTTGGAAQLQAQAWPDYFGRRHVGAITGSTILIITPAMAAGPLVAAAVYDILGSYIQIFSIYAGAAFFAGVLFFLAKPPVRPSVHGDDE